MNQSGAFDRGEGVVCNDASFVMPPSRASLRRDIVAWRKMSEQEQGKWMAQVMEPFLDVISDSPGDAEDIYNQSDIKAQIRDFISNSQQEAAIREQLKQANGGNIKIKTISFSKATKKDIDFIGVEDSDQKSLFDRMKANALEALSFNNTVCGSANGIWVQLPEMVILQKFLHMTSESMPHVNEANARKVIDLVFLGLSIVAKSTDHHGQLHALELTVFSPKDRKTAMMPIVPPPLQPVVLEETHIIFHGFIDYVLITAESTYSKRSIKNLKDQLSNDCNATLVFSNCDARDFHVVVCEAKKQSKCVEDLLKHEPQVIAETMAMISCKFPRVEENQRKENYIYLPWCLTDGAHWVLGAVVYSIKDKRWQKYKYGNYFLNLDGLEHESPGLQDLIWSLFVLSVRKPKGM